MAEAMHGLGDLVTALRHLAERAKGRGFRRAASPPSTTATGLRLRHQLVVVDDVVTIDKPAVFPVEKDRPILFSALAAADVLPTLARDDFGRLLGDRFYGLAIMTPGMWL